MTVNETKPIAITLTNHNRSEQCDESEFSAITCNLLKAWGKSRLHGAIGFGFASHLLKKLARLF